jgi:fumarate reductase subunit C
VIVKTKEYIRPVPATWWLHNRHLFLFMIRELTSVFVAAYAIFLLVVLFKFSQGEETFRQFLNNVLTNPVVIGLQVVALIFVVYHSITSFNAAPVLMVVWRGEEKVSPGVIVGGNYALWLIMSGVIFVYAISA